MTRPRNDPLPETCRDAKGTVRGYGRHARRGEYPCDRCREAINAYNRQRRSGWGDEDFDTMRRKARARAWAALQRRHPDEFAVIMRVEMGRLLAVADQKATRPYPDLTAAVAATTGEETPA